jgi:hypothetical protein
MDSCPPRLRLRRNRLAGLAVATASLLGLHAPRLDAAPPPRIGDPGSVFDPAKADPRYPDAKEWARAGVEGGIPFRHQSPVVARLKPGDDVATAVQKARAGVVLLAPGVYPLAKEIAMKSQVILRGEDREKTILEYGSGDKNQRIAVHFKKTDRAGLEDLTLRHKHIAQLDPAVYLGKYANHPDFVQNDDAAVEMTGAKNCWVQNCQILFSISRPVRVWGNSAHVTLRDNIVDKCLHKGGKGAGYYEIVGATYVLLYNERVTNIRHICLDGTIDYSVLVHVVHGVDINWHCIAPMAKSLVEECEFIQQEHRHTWGQWCHYRQAVDASNRIYRCKPGYDDGSVYFTNFPGEGDAAKGGPFIKKLDQPPPKSGTLYPVTGVHRPPDEPRGAAKINAAGR